MLTLANTSKFEQLESGVRSYCRNWPVVFDRAAGSCLYDESGRRYLDFFTGAGALNYGHNNPALKQPLVEYLTSDRVIHSLDTYTVAKREFLEALDEVVLRPRALSYRVQFPGPAGTNAVEAALKIARKVTGRTEVVRFNRGFHGMTLGALAVTSNRSARAAAGTPLRDTVAAPFDDASLDGSAPELAWFDRLVDRNPSGKPAAVIVETVQGEGGVNVARPSWLRALAARCRDSGVILIVDDVQMGCGRTGQFFSFERAGIVPDVMCLSKSISGYGLPLALTLIRPDLDVWEPGEHNGTFRGFNPAFVTGAAALRTYWSDDALQYRTIENGMRVAAALGAIAREVDGAEARGIGMAHGLAFRDPGRARAVASAAFDRQLLVETAGPHDEVVKLLPPLTLADDELEEGLAVLHEAVRATA